jgi:hypothetical protein
MRKGLLLLRGESFRLGGQFSRNIGSDSVFSSGVLAAKSHKHFVDKINLSGNVLDVALDTTSTKYDYVLREIFGDIKSYNFRTKPNLSQYLGLQSALDYIEYLFKENDYDFLLISRNDIVLKDHFLDVFNVEDRDVKFCSVCWYENRKLVSGLPRVVDTIFYIPKNYFGLRKTFRAQGFKDGHDILDLWLGMLPNLVYSFYLSTYHDSNTSNDWNPLYMMIGREECLEHKSGDSLLFPRDF